MIFLSEQLDKKQRINSSPPFPEYCTILSNPGRGVKKIMPKPAIMRFLEGFGRGEPFLHARCKLTENGS